MITLNEIETDRETVTA